MPEPNKQPDSNRSQVSLTYDQLMNLLTEARRPNALEQRAMDEEIERDKRRALLAVELARAEEEMCKRKKHACSHSRFALGAGRNAGQSAPRGTGEWTTGGQLVGPNQDTAHLICLRCSYGWQWKVAAQEREYINNVGLLGCAPPAAELVTWEG